MEFMEDYDFELHYHPEKANIVADALSRKSISALAGLAVREWKMMEDNISEFGLQLRESVEQASLFTAIAQPTLFTGVVEEQKSDQEVKTIRERISKGKEEKG
ncbi:hypothetical protein ACSBR1_017992 [Camellia fascicularis]